MLSLFARLSRTDPGALVEADSHVIAHAHVGNYLNLMLERMFQSHVPFESRAHPEIPLVAEKLFLMLLSRF